MRANPRVTRRIQASGSETRATGAKSERRASWRRFEPTRWTIRRWTRPKTNWEIRVNPRRGRTTVWRAEPRTAPITRRPATTLTVLRNHMGRYGALVGAPSPAGSTGWHRRAVGVGMSSTYANPTTTAVTEWSRRAGGRRDR